MSKKDKKILTKKKDSKLSYFKDEKNQGRWRLKLIIDDDQVEKFSLVTLPAYEHPKTGQKYFPSHKNQPLSHLVVDQIITIFNPDQEPTQRNLIDWLITHPEVKVDGLAIEEKILNNKSKPKFILVNIDNQDFTEMEENNIIDEMIGRLSFTSGPYSISAKRLRYAAAALDINFKDKRHANNPKTEILHLKNKLKTYVRKSKEAALKFKEIISNVDHAEKIFAIKVLTESKDINYEFGIYKYNGSLLGSSIDSVVALMTTDLTLNNEMVEKAKAIFKEQGFNI